MKALKLITQAELHALIEKHEQWLATIENDAKKLFLQCVDLRNLDFHSADQRSSTIVMSSLSGDNLSYLHLSYRDLSSPQCISTSYTHAIMIPIDRAHTKVEWANPIKANLENACLAEANISEADASLANMKNANLRGAMRKGADFGSTNLKNTTLYPSNTLDVSPISIYTISDVLDFDEQVTYLEDYDRIVSNSDEYTLEEFGKLPPTLEYEEDRIKEVSNKIKLAYDFFKDVKDLD
ncbi:pentapeptide repeat-containing protein [Staphylococcus phage vB_SauH_DELF3]|nr:pentapeptide repeat-containing protein [Staphylococcus phage vB_SauH_DELF3]